MTTTSSFALLGSLADRWLETDSRAPSTKRAYRHEIDRLLAWLTRTQARPDDRDLLLRFLNDLASSDEHAFRRAGAQRPLQTSSLLQAKRILGAFLLWASVHDHVSVSISQRARLWSPPEIVCAKPSKASHGRDCLDPRVSSKQSKSRGLSRISQVREQFVTGLTYWCGARPHDLVALKRTNVRVRDGLLEVDLPDGLGRLTRSLAPPALAACWRELSKLSIASSHAITQLRSAHPLSAGAVSRILGALDHPSGRRWNATRLRCVAQLRLLQSGWSEAEIRRQFRRKSIRAPGVAISHRKMRSMTTRLDC